MYIHGKLCTYTKKNQIFMVEENRSQLEKQPELRIDPVL